MFLPNSGNARPQSWVASQLGDYLTGVDTRKLQGDRELYV